MDEGLFLGLDCDNTDSQTSTTTEAQVGAVVHWKEGIKSHTNVN